MLYHDDGILSAREPKATHMARLGFGSLSERRDVAAQRRFYNWGNDTILRG
jgi:hypothetical protein